MKYLKYISLFMVLFFSHPLMAQDNDQETEKLLREAEQLITETDKILDKPNTTVPLDNSLKLPIIIFSVTLILSVIYYFFLLKNNRKKPVIEAKTETEP